MNGIVDLDDRLRRLDQLLEATQEEITRLTGRKARALELIEERKRAAHLAALDRLAAPATVRAWARAQGIPIGLRGRVSRELREQYLARQAGGPGIHTDESAAVRHPDQGRDSFGVDTRTADELEDEIRTCSEVTSEHA